MSKYAPVADLLRRSRSRVTVTFAELDDLVGGLPESARHHRGWWGNEASGGHVQARAWLEAGWRVESVTLTGGRVTFVQEVGGD